jgi:tetratricopeptide (TPR) repeat protein
VVVKAMKKSTWLVLMVMVSLNAWASETCQQALLSGNHLVALGICDQALQDHPDQELDIWLHLVDIHHVLGHQQKERHYLQLIKQHPDFIERPDIQYEWSRKKGQQHYFRNEYQQALEYFTQGLQLAGDDPVNAGKSHNDLGLVNNMLNNHTKALHHFQQSLTLKLEHGTAYQLGNTLNNIALVHVALENHDQAVDFYQQALDQYIQYSRQEVFDERVAQQISHIYEDLTSAYTKSGKTEAAGLYARKVLATFELKKSPQAQARALINIGRMHLEFEQYDQAELFYQQARKLLQDHGLPTDALFYHDLATIKFHQERNEEAIQLATQGVVLAENLQDHQTLSQLYELLSDVFKQTSLDTSLDYLKKYQVSREAFLEEKYNQELSTVLHQIEMQKVQHDLVNEQLASARKSAQVQRLNNTVLIAALIIVLMGVILMMYVFRKRKERAELMQSIKHHRQQLFMMQEEQEQQSGQAKTEEPADLRQQFKISLVDLMVDALAIWEKNTGSDRIELAEKSRAWTVSIDNGTLRTRSMDKYLELDKMPANPRWRQVVKTCHFILSAEELDSKDRNHLEAKLDQLLHQAKELSLSTGA